MATNEIVITKKYRTTDGRRVTLTEIIARDDFDAGWVVRGIIAARPPEPPRLNARWKRDGRYALSGPHCFDLVEDCTDELISLCHDVLRGDV